MKPTRRFGYPPLIMLPLVTMFLAFSLNCSSHARATTVRGSEAAVTAEEYEAAVPAEEYEADEFIGVPIVGDYDDNPNLDFILEVRDGDRTFKVEVHEDVNSSNREAIDLIRKRINEMEDMKQLRVIGYYSPEYRGASKEYGFMDLKCVIFFDEETGYEEAYFTDARESRYYDNGDVTVVYAPGHHYNGVYYPRYCSPWWDIDGDGIPNRYDLWPMTYDVWYDYNLNYIPDWYDPYYCSYYPYWSYWNSGFWVSYRWYSPGYFRSGYLTHAYYDDYRTYTRLYDERYVSTSRKNYHLDPKTEYYNRASQSRVPRATSLRTVSSGTGYVGRPADRRRLVPAASESTLDSESEALVTQIDSEPRTFSRNRAVTETAGDDRIGRTRADRVIDFKQKSDAASVSSTSRLRGVDRTRTSEGRTDERADRPLGRNRSSGGDNRVYSPTTRDRSVSSSSAVSSGVITGKTKARSSQSGRLTRPRTSSNTRTGTRYRGSSQSRPSSERYSYPAPSRSREVRSSSPSPRPSASSSSPSRSRSEPSPSVRSAPSSSRSSPAPRARSSSGSSSSRSSGSSAKGSSSSGGDRRRR